MRVFLSDRDVALALCPDADWQADRLSGYDVDASGALVAGGGTCDGVSSPCAVPLGEPFKSYFNGLSDEVKPAAGVHGPVLAAVSTSTQPAEFTPYARRVEACVAADAAQILAAPTAHNTPVNRAGLLMRARSFVRAERSDTRVPVSLRRGFRRDAVQQESRALPYARYFDVEDVNLRHPRFDGGLSPVIERTVLRAADAVTVLPYDPVRDQVVVIEQFRPAAYVRGDCHPWVLEPVAGRCDGDEPVEEVARRELVEEAGLTLLGLEKIANYYPSPGCLSEYLFTFLGLVDLSKAQSGVHGVASEDEDIQTHILTFDDAMALVASGEADNGPLLLSLYWLGANRERLRREASAA
ncbi:NUDIX domain-containing protein [Neptunicoccus cionae]|uniref:ADP-ribose pyrophosphatase n=1 Tax=Neptunicoccus cionae TaxID=2035344 RepID=A0A916VMR3_9RHOB|nr:NUDIX domain-containing protein [Amylibacter cionae]GGA09423.1 tellurite resistance protein [Amylibacter cionae]